MNERIQAYLIMAQHAFSCALQEADPNSELAKELLKLSSKTQEFRTN